MAILGDCDNIIRSDNKANLGLKTHWITKTKGIQKMLGGKPTALLRAAGKNLTRFVKNVNLVDDPRGDESERHAGDGAGDDEEVHAGHRGVEVDGRLRRDGGIAALYNTLQGDLSG